MPATAPADEIVAATGLLAMADHVPPDGLATKLAVVVGAQTLWSPPALGLVQPEQACTVTCTVSLQPFKV